MGENQKFNDLWNNFKWSNKITGVLEIKGIEGRIEKLFGKKWLKISKFM